MYKDHCLGIIAPAMRADLDVFRRGCMFAVCSIRQPTTSVPDQLGRLFDGEEGENPLFGHKFRAWDWINNNANCARLWAKLTCCNFYYTDKEGCRGAILALLEVPGLGIVKSAFIAQLMGFDVACLDSRNIKREGRNPRAYETRGDKSGRKSNQALVARYVAETYGRAEEYWDAWCHDVAVAYKMDPEAVSALHLAIIPDNYIPF